MEQGRYPARSQSANDKPNLGEYPEYYSEEFAAAASTTAENVRLEDLTQPTQKANDAARSQDHNSIGENDEVGDYEPDGDYDDRHGPLKADAPLADPTVPIPNTFQAVDASDIDDFALSNLAHVLWVPMSCLHQWGQVFSTITGKLHEVICSDGPSRHRRFEIAARWYLGMPQILLRNPGRGQERNAKIIERRLIQFPAGDFSSLLSEWRADKAKAQRQAKPPMPERLFRRVTLCIQRFCQGYVSRGLRYVEGNGKANTEDTKVIAQMAEKHPEETENRDEPTPGERPNLGSMPDVVQHTKPLTSVGPRGLHAGPIKQLFTGNFPDTSDKDSFELLGQVYFSCEMPTWLRQVLNSGLITPLVKKPAPDGQTPDARPTNARDIDVSIWLKTIQRRGNAAARALVVPQQLAVGVTSGCEIKIIGAKLMIEQASGSWRILF
jgi:hypothetical protein